MDIKMKCMYKKGSTECTDSSILTCNECRIQVFFCQAHVGAHIVDTNHNKFEKLGLIHFKKQIKNSISNIVKYASDAITEIRRTSLNTIIHLKQVVKNVKNIDELTLKSFDAERISFLVEQVRDIDKKMNEILQETTEKINIRKQDLTDQIVNILTKRGTGSKDFNRMPFNEKNTHIQKNWSFMINGNIQYTQELLLSKDGKYIFQCKFKLGKIETDLCNLNGRS